MTIKHLIYIIIFKVVNQLAKHQKKKKKNVGSKTKFIIGNL